MPVVTPDDVLAGVKALWNDDLDLAAAVPGKLWHQRPEQGAVMPYARAEIQEGETEEFSGLDYLQRFTVRIGVFSNSAPSDTGAIRGLMEARFRRTDGLAVPNATRVTHVRPVPGGLTIDDKTREAGNVLVATGAWEILVQGTRG